MPSYTPPIPIKTHNIIQKQSSLNIQPRSISAMPGSA